MARNDTLISVEVSYALPLTQLIIEIKVAAGTTARQAIEASGILQRYAEIDLVRQKVGIFGEVVEQDRLLRQGDRVEIYRALIADPKESRRRRAGKKT